MNVNDGSSTVARQQQLEKWQNQQQQQHQPRQQNEQRIMGHSQYDN